MHDKPFESASETIGRFASSVSLSSTPGEVVDRARACLLHGLAAGIGGRDSGFGQRAASALAPEGVSGPATSLLSGRRVPESIAAFVNGVALHARVQDDTHSALHPGTVVIPAALAVAEGSGSSGDDFLAGVLAGYEVGIDLSASLSSFVSPPFRVTSVLGPVAAAAAAGRALRLGPAALSAAVALASAFAGGTAGAFAAGSDEGRFQAGQAAAAGLTAAVLARAGARGSPHAFEGETGFLRCFAPGHGGAVATGLGQSWRIGEVAFKTYPVCAFNQAAVEAAVQLADEVEDSDTVRSVMIRMNARQANYPGVSALGPFSDSSQTLMSAPFCVAVALAERIVTLSSLGRFGDPAISGLVARTTVVPEHDRKSGCASVCVEVSDGRRIERSVTVEHDAGVWSTAHVVAHSRHLVNEVGVTEPAWEQVGDAVRALGQGGRVSDAIAAVVSANCFGPQDRVVCPESH